MFYCAFTDGINDMPQSQRGSTLHSTNPRDHIHSYPDPNTQAHFSSNMIASPKGGGPNKMFHNPHKITPGSVFSSGHFASSQQTSNSLHPMINNNNSSHQQHLNQPWSNGSAGSSGKSKCYPVCLFNSMQLSNNNISN